jgi:hypothetical protein
MSLDAEIAADFLTMLDDYGVTATFGDQSALALVSQVRNEQELDLGGMVQSPDLKIRLPKSSFDPLPTHGSMLEIDGEDYRVSKVSAHPRSPLVTFELVSPFDS